MKFEDVKLGMKVVPHSKTAGCVDLMESTWGKAQNQNQDYLFVRKINNNNTVLLWHTEIDLGDIFYAEDFEPYEVKVEKPKQTVEIINVGDNQIKVIFSGTTTIVILPDGSKGVSKCMEGDTYNKETGQQIAFLKAGIKRIEKVAKQTISKYRKELKQYSK